MHYYDWDLYYDYIMRAFVDTMNILGYLAIDTFSTMIATLWTIIDAATKVWRFGAVTIFFSPYNNERKSHAAMLIRQVAIKVTSSTSADVYYNFLLIMIGVEEIQSSIYAITSSKSKFHLMRHTYATVHCTIVTIGVNFSTNDECCMHRGPASHAWIQGISRNSLGTNKYSKSSPNLL